MKGGGRVHISQASNKGHTVSFHQPDRPSSKNEIGRYTPPEEKVYSPGDHEQMISDIRSHLGLGRLGAKSKTDNLADQMKP